MKNITVLMYHYIRDYSESSDIYFKGMDIKDFEYQLIHFLNNGGIICPHDFLKFIKGENYFLKGQYLLTFDDGLKDSYRYVFPLFQKYNVNGIFNLITKSIQNSIIPVTHKIHILMGKLGDYEFSQNIVREYNTLFSIDYWSHLDKKKAHVAYRWDTSEIKEFKWVLNFGLKSDDREILIDTIFSRIFDEKSSASEFFLTWEEIDEMANSGNIFGGHTHSHVNLSALNSLQQEIEIQTCYNLLTRRIKQISFPFSYPFGKKINYSTTTINILKDIGFCCAFSNIQGINNYENFSKYEINRLDPKDINKNA